MTRTEDLHIPPFLPVLVAFLMVLAPVPTTAQQASGGPIEARLVAEDLSIQPGRSFTVALEMTIHPDWHVYWKYPGDSGLPTTLEWSLPPGFTAGPLKWPVPERYISQDLVTYGYSRHVLLVTEITPPRDLKTGVPVVLKAKAGWLACRVECTPGTASLELPLPVRPGVPQVDAGRTGLFREAKDQLPSAPGPEQVSARADGKQVMLVRNGGALPNDAQAFFYPDAPGQVRASSQRAEVDAGSVRLRLQRESAAGPLKRLVGLLVTTRNGKSEALEVDDPSL